MLCYIILYNTNKATLWVIGVWGGAWAHGAHGPMGPWAHGPNGPMGPWAHAPPHTPITQRVAVLLFFPKQL